MSRLLLDTADNLEHGEWCQNAERKGEARCVMQWLNYTWMAGKRPAADFMTAVDRLLRYLNLERRPDLWNDVPGRTKAEVVTALRAAAHSPQQ